MVRGVIFTMVMMVVGATSNHRDATLASSLRALHRSAGGTTQSEEEMRRLWDAMDAVDQRFPDEALDADARVQMDEFVRMARLSGSG